MTTDLVARLRGIIDAKPPHVTVLADNEEVYPIRVELLREAADYIDWVKQWGDDWRKKYVEAEARLAAQQTILSTLEGERRRLTDRLTAAEAERDEWREAAHHEDLLCEARRAAAERVVEEALAELNHGQNDHDPNWWKLGVRARTILARYEKAYSSEEAASRFAQELLRSEYASGTDPGRLSTQDLSRTADLNSAKQEGE